VKIIAIEGAQFVAVFDEWESVHPKIEGFLCRKPFLR